MSALLLSPNTDWDGSESLIEDAFLPEWNSDLSMVLVGANPAGETDPNDGSSNSYIDYGYHGGTPADFPAEKHSHFDEAPGDLFYDDSSDIKNPLADLGPISSAVVPKLPITVAEILTPIDFGTSSQSGTSTASFPVIAFTERQTDMNFDNSPQPKNPIPTNCPVTAATETRVARNLKNSPQPECSAPYEQLSEHVDLGFRLVEILDETPFPRAPSSKECDLIKRYFGNDFLEITFHSPFLILRMDPLPPKPWPLTVAELPVWVTHKSSSELPPFLGYQGTMNDPFLLQVASITPWRVPCESIFDIIIGHFIWANLRLLSLTFLGNRWLVTLEGEFPFIDTLPAQAGGLPIFYTPRIHTLAGEQQHGTKTCKDNTRERSRFAEPISGMMVDSVRGGHLTVSGIPLFHPNTQEMCITISDHAFSLWDTVYRAYTENPRTPVATVLKKVERTGIRLARVDSCKAYIRKHLGDHCETDRFLRGIEGLVVGTKRYNIDSPWVGFGVVILVGIERTVRRDENSQTNVLTYAGNDHLFPDYAFCGARVYNPWTQEVVALFQCGRDRRGIFSSSSVQPIINLGYRVPTVDSMTKLEQKIMTMVSCFN